MTEQRTWAYRGLSTGGEFKIDGINVWGHEWSRVPELTAKVRDPAYGSSFEFHVYEILEGGKRIMFASGEFSNGVFGFYLPTGARV